MHHNNVLKILSTYNKSALECGLKSLCSQRIYCLCLPELGKTQRIKLNDLSKDIHYHFKHLEMDASLLITH